MKGGFLLSISCAFVLVIDSEFFLNSLVFFTMILFINISFDSNYQRLSSS